MQVDHVFILAAGKGTRMGQIGKVLPKLLWPVFDLPLLDLQVLYARKHFPGATISINTYNYSDQIESHVRTSKNLEGITLVKEEKIIDIGGGIQNMASLRDYRGIAAILNGDQFLMVGNRDISEALKRLEDNSVCLLSYQVNSSDGYNALDCSEDNILKGITLNSEIARDSQIFTYTGNSFIRLDQLRKQKGLSKFFDSIANPDLDKVAVKELSNHEYWDFGTLERYHQSHFELLNNRGAFYQFLKTISAFDLSEFYPEGYRSRSGINLRGDFVETVGSRSIVLDRSEIPVEEEKKRIIYRDLVETLS